MLLLQSLKISLTALAVVTLFAAAAPARAEVHHADAYESLTAVPLSPGHAPRTINGVADLSAGENRHHEHLPVQLDGAIKKVKKAKYQPSGLARDNPTDF